MTPTPDAAALAAGRLGYERRALAPWPAWMEQVVREMYAADAGLRSLVEENARLARFARMVYALGNHPDMYAVRGAAYIALDAVTAPPEEGT